MTPFQHLLELTRVEVALGQSSVILRAISTCNPKLLESHSQTMLTRVGDDVGLLQDANVSRSQARELQRIGTLSLIDDQSRVKSRRFGPSVMTCYENQARLCPSSQRARVLGAKGRFESLPVPSPIDCLTAGLRHQAPASANKMEVFGYHRRSTCVDYYFQ